MPGEFPRRFEPWRIDESDFYELDSHAAQLAFLVRYGVLAPSGHNSQPWTFRTTEDGIEVYADYARRVPHADPADRELMISVGAAITNLCVAAAHFGFESTVLYQARPEESLPVALVALRETCAPDSALTRLFGAITARHTHRGTFDTRPIDESTLTELCDFIESHSAWVRFLVPHDRTRAAELVARAERVLMASSTFRGELADWTRPNDTDAGDGICADGFGIPDPLGPATPWFLRRFDVGSVRSSRSRSLVEHAAGLIVLTSEDDHVSLIRCGETLELLLLLLTRLGLNYSFMNGPIEVDTLRSELWSMTRSAHPPQLLLRIGYARTRPNPQPRRQVEKVLV